MRKYTGGVIPVPTYLLEDDELRAMVRKLQEIDGESEEHDGGRAATCIVAIRSELAKRDGIIGGSNA